MRFEFKTYNENEVIVSVKTLSDMEKESQLLKKEIQILREALEDFRNFGTRHDINPTGQFMDCGCFQSMSNDSWQGYIRSQDTMTRLRAKQFLAEADKIKGELG